MASAEFIRRRHAANVSVQGGYNPEKPSRDQIAASLIESGMLTADTTTLRAAARAMLKDVVSCLDNNMNSGFPARVVGDAIGAGRYLPTMATEEFLACLSKPALERAATAEGVPVGTRGKDTRANLVTRFAGTTWVYPAAVFTMTEEYSDKISGGGPFDGCPA